MMATRCVFTCGKCETTFYEGASCRCPSPDQEGPQVETARDYDVCHSCKPDEYGNSTKAFIRVLFGGLLVCMCRKCFGLLKIRGRREGG